MVRYPRAENPAAKKKAITAIAHTLLKIAYQVLKSGTPYHEPGADFYVRRESPAQRQAFLERQLQKLHPGCTVISPSAPGGRLNARRLTTSPDPRPGAAAVSGTPALPAGQSAPSRTLAPPRSGSAAARPAGTSFVSVRNHAPLRGAAVGHENWVPGRRRADRRWRGLAGSGGGRGGRCTVVLTCRPSSPFVLGPFEAGVRLAPESLAG